MPKRSTYGQTWIDPEELAYNTPTGTQWGSDCRAFVRCADGELRTVTVGTADTFFSIPAHYRTRGRTVKGFVSMDTAGKELTFTKHAPKEAATDA